VIAMPVKIALAAIVGVIVVHTAFGKNGLRENLAIIRQYRLQHILTSLLVAAAVAGSAYGLLLTSPVFGKNPILWVISEVFHAGNGNGQGNLIFSGLDWKWYAVVFLPVLALALPRFAQMEEVKYRTGTRNWLDGSLKSLRFGLAHMFMLIPFGASLALTLAGLWFTRQYFRGGVERSAVYHAAFNTTIVVVLFVVVIFI
jgi:hypothetical protein